MENNIIPTAGIFIVKDEKVLLVGHNKASDHINKKYGIPGGRLESGETTIEAARRELKEETGLSVELNNLISLPGEWQAIIERKDGTKKKFSVVVFIADKFEGQLSGNNETTPEWVNLGNLDNYDLLPNHNEIINTGIKFLKDK